MQFLVFGASGRTGTSFVQQASAAGHEVVAVVRNPDALLSPGVEVRIGDVMDPESVAAAIRGEPTIISTLGGIDALTIGSANVIRVAAAAGVRRMLGVVGAGVLQADATHKGHELPNYPPFLRPVGTAHQAFLAALEQSALDWTLACTPNIVDGDATGRIASQRDYLPNGSGAITTGDVAAFLLAEATAGQFLRARVGLNTSA